MTMNSATGDLTVYLNRNQKIANNTIYNIFMVFKNIGQVSSTKELVFTLNYPYFNQAPRFVEEPSPL